MAPWFRGEIKKNKTNKQNGTNNTKKIRNEIQHLVMKTKKGHWKTFSKKLESDYYSLQKQMWGFVRQQRKEVNELVETRKMHG